MLHKVYKHLYFPDYILYFIEVSDVSEHSRTVDGAQGRNRTTDTAIFNRMLYQLSYLGAGTRRTAGGRARAL